MRHTWLFLLAGALASASASRVSADGTAASNPKLRRRPSVPAITTGTLAAADPSAIAQRWGVEISGMRLASGGYMLEFRYRIVDAAKAQPLFDPKLRPILKDDASGFESVVPNPPTTGSLRSTYDAKAGRTYFMFFANPSRFVSAGKTVTVTIGDFVVYGIAVTDDSAPAVAQKAEHAGHEGHEAHMAQLAAASTTSGARLMAPQPVVGEIPLVDQNGRATTLREAIGTDKPVLINFIFTTCTTICPVMSAGMSQLLTNLGPEGDRARVVSISIDPELDTVDALRAYAARYNAPPSWLFLTGTRAAVEAAQRAFGSYRGGKNNHVAGTFVRSAPDSPWLALEGFSSAQTLQHAMMGHLVPSSGS
jgi:protein SCO1/2